MAQTIDYAYLADLVVASIDNDSEAFATLYSLTYNKVYKYCVHYLHDTYLAQDAVQEIYLTALKNLKRLEDPTLFIAWLNQISFHVCYDIVKKENKAGESVDMETLETIKDDLEVKSSIEDAYMNKAMHQLLRESIEALPFNEKQVVVMYYFSHLKLREIAHATGFSLSSVKRYISSAQDHLREMLK